MVYVYVCSSLVRFSSKMQCLHMLMTLKVTYQGQGSSEVKLGGKCWFLLFGSPLKSLSPIGTKLASKMVWGFLCMLMTSNVMFQGQGSSEVKLGGKCNICIICLITAKCALLMQHVNLLLGEWVGLSLT